MEIEEVSALVQAINAAELEIARAALLAEHYKVEPVRQHLRLLQAGLVDVVQDFRRGYPELYRYPQGKGSKV